MYEHLPTGDGGHREKEADGRGRPTGEGGRRERAVVGLQAPISIRHARALRRTSYRARGGVHSTRPQHPVTAHSVLQHVAEMA